MAKISDIKRELQWGDQKVIAKIVKCSPETVKKVLNGERSHRTGKGQKIVEIAEKIIAYRQQLKDLMNS